MNTQDNMPSHTDGHTGFHKRHRLKDDDAFAMYITTSATNDCYMNELDEDNAQLGDTTAKADTPKDDASFGKNKRNNSAGQHGESKKSTSNEKSQPAFDILKGLFVRACLVLGNVAAAWRTVNDTGDSDQWYISICCGVLMLLEFGLVVYFKKGMEWNWWSPCFLIYLGTTLPLVWQLQIRQHYAYLEELDNANAKITGTSALVSNATLVTSNISTVATTSAAVTTEATRLRVGDISIDLLKTLGNDVWVIIVNESVVYLIIFARWFLPRGNIAREHLADMLLQFVAMASDIMELLAIFDEGPVRGNLVVNYWILSVWSLSFLQFVPLLVRRHQLQPDDTRRSGCNKKYCGGNRSEIIITCMGISLQDGPFLVLRMYIIFKIDIITYSIVFFVFKNFVTLMLLCYRLFILLSNGCCCNKPQVNS